MTTQIRKQYLLSFPFIIYNRLHSSHSCGWLSYVLFDVLFTTASVRLVTTRPQIYRCLFTLWSRYPIHCFKMFLFSKTNHDPYLDLKSLNVIFYTFLSYRFCLVFFYNRHKVTIFCYENSRVTRSDWEAYSATIARYITVCRRGKHTLPTIIDTERFKAAVKFALIHYLKTGSSLSLRKQ